MDTKSQLENDLKAAMRANNDLQKRTLRMALAAIRLAEIEKGSPLEENAVLVILQKEMKSRFESIEDAQRAACPDLIENSQAEITVLEGYLPKQMSAEELEALVKQVIAETGASSPREMGQVMKILIPRLEGRASGDQASQLVRKLLQ